jgi:hypothetical protein
VRKVINQREKQPNPEVLQGFKDLPKVFSPSLTRHWRLARVLGMFDSCGEVIIMM